MHHRVLITVLALCLVGLWTHDAQSQIRQMDQAYKRCSNPDSNAKKRINYCSRLIKKTSSDHGFPMWEAHFYRGTAHAELNALEDAIKDLELAVDHLKNPRGAYKMTRRPSEGSIKAWEAQICRARGEAYMLSKKYDLADADYTRVIELYPEDAPSFRDRGIVRAASGRLDAGIADLDRSIELQSKDPLTFVYRGAVHKQMGNIELAEADDKQARRLRGEPVD